MADFISYVILGLLQGIFEWIPISSEGVVALAARYLNAGVDPIDSALFLHAGTLAAALVYYRADWLRVLAFKDRKLLIFLLISTIVSLPLGLVFYKLIEQTAVGGGLLLLTGFGLLFTALFQKKKTGIKISDEKLAAVAGVLQGLAVIPGFSRSGSTIFGLSLAKSDPKEILKLSYLMSVPAVGASTLYLLVFKGGSHSIEIWPALAASFFCGLIFLDVLSKASEKLNFFKFALIFAALCFAGAFLEFLPRIVIF
jgi:undecaprenyl-diphosphatase